MTQHQFRPGERVRINMSNGSPMKPGDEGVIESCGDAFCMVRAVVKTDPDIEWMFTPDMLSLLAPTPAQKLRDAAEVLKDIGQDTWAACLRAEARRLESAAAPKPPTLREAAEAVVKRWAWELETKPNLAPRHIRNLAAALSREEPAQ